MIYVRYKKSGWSNWVTWGVKSREEAEKIIAILRGIGYEVEG
jgi:hypothetical protein